MEDRAIPPLHGVIIKEHKHWNTKTIYDQGQVIIIYRYCPKVIRFESPMVNDMNQHFCYGWHLSGLPKDNDGVEQQLMARRKPFGSMHFREETDALEARQRLLRAGLVTDLKSRLCPVWNDPDAHMNDLLACQPITVGEIGDPMALEEDYHGAGIDVELRDGIASYPLSDFFGGWDVPRIPLWMVGLILGYPVENTISIYRQ